MGLLIDGIWRDAWYDTSASGGRFVRPRTRFRNWVTPDGAAGPTGVAGFAAAPGRYHLYVSLACPWAHRTLIMRALKGLEALVPISVVHWRMLDHGWTFEDGPGVIPDPIHHADYLYQVYLAADPAYTGRVTTPTLWDRQTGTIVSNESAEILRMFNSAFDGVGARAGRLLSGRSARRDRHAERAHLRHRQQRRLQGRLRHDAAGLRRSGRSLVRDAGLARGAGWPGSATCAASG